MSETGLDNWRCYTTRFQKSLFLYFCFLHLLSSLLFPMMPFLKKKKRNTKPHKMLVPLLKMIAVCFSCFIYSLIILVLMLIDLNKKDWDIKSAEIQVWRVLVFTLECW